MIPTSTTAYIVTCEGPPLDYTTRVNLHRADVFPLPDGRLLDPRFGDAPRGVRLRIEAASADEAIARVRELLASRPYVDFSVVSREPVARPY